MTTTDAQKKRPALRRLLAWLRIEDEHGVLSLTTAAVLLGAVWLLKAVSPIALVVFVVGAVGYQAKKHRQYRLAQLGIQGANAHAITQLRNQHELALAARGTDVEALVAKVKDIEGKISLLATPEQQERLRRVLRGGQ